MNGGRWSAALAIAAVTLIVLAGCAPSTGATGPPSPAVTQMPSPSPVSSPTDAATPIASPALTEVPTVAPFTLSSSAFAEGGAIPRANTCDGANRSIPLAWANAPAGTVAFALVMDDPDAGGFIHWVAYNMAGNGLEEGAAEADAPPQGKNSFGNVGYGGPCPPSGTHHYVVRLLALDAMLSLSGTPSASAVLAAAAGHTLAEARLTGTYKRGG